MDAVVATRMPVVLAVDCDRTLTGADLVPDPGALSSVAKARAGGIRCILVTGRSREDLAAHADIPRAFDAYVLEGGAAWGMWADLKQPANAGVALSAAQGLEEAGISVERRTGSFSCARHDLDAVRRVAAGCSIQANVDRVDVTPPGVDKGSGLDAVLGLLGLRDAHVVAVGDGENDVPLFGRASVGLAVANAAPGLKRHADEVLPLPGPEGLVGAIERLLAGEWRPLEAARPSAGPTR